MKQCTGKCVLPAIAYVDHAYNGTVIAVRRGVEGYYQTVFADARQANDAIGVTPAQAAAMQAGSMFGWDCPAADPCQYDEEGRTQTRNWLRR